MGTGTDALRRDYERVARSGVRRLTAQTDPELLAALDRLVACGLAIREHEVFALLPAEHAGGLDPGDRSLFSTLREEWLHLDDRRVDPGDQLLYGELGYWTHWWNMLHERPDREAVPLRMDFVIADDGSFAARDWVGELDPRIVDYVIGHRLVTGRVIVAPGQLETPAGDIVRVARTMGVEVRIFSSPVHYAVYDDAAVVLREEFADGPEAHRLTRGRPVVDAMRHLFALQWAMALPWNDVANGGPDILRLLAQGLTDAQIAAATNVSVRTVSRRVTDAMRAAGVQSRFQLGMRFTQTDLGDARD